MMEHELPTVNANDAILYVFFWRSKRYFPLHAMVEMAIPIKTPATHEITSKARSESLRQDMNTAVRVD